MILLSCCYQRARIDMNIFAEIGPCMRHFHRRYTRFLAKHRTQLLIAAYFWSGFGRGFALGHVRGPGEVTISPGPGVDAGYFEAEVPGARVGALRLGARAHSVAVGLAVLPSTTICTTIVKVETATVETALRGIPASGVRGVGQLARLHHADPWCRGGEGLPRAPSTELAV